jgi:acetoin utilization protein AcuB
MIGRQRKGRHVFCIDKNTDIVRARDLMREKKVRHLPVVDEHKRLIGIVSDRDIRTAIPREAYENRESLEAYASSEAIKITEIMTKDPYCISATYTLQDALLLFKKTKVGAFPIVDQDQTVVGIISDRDLLHGFIDLLGVGSPGCFIGVVIPPSPRIVSRIVSAFAEKEIVIASMLAIKDWKEEKQALFLYLLTQDIRQSRHLVTAMNFELIDPMQWFFYQHTADETL